MKNKNISPRTGCRFSTCQVAGRISAQGQKRVEKGQESKGDEHPERRKLAEGQRVGHGLQVEIPTALVPGEMGEPGAALAPVRACGQCG